MTTSVQNAPKQGDKSAVMMENSIYATSFLSSNAANTPASIVKKTQNLSVLKMEVLARSWADALIAAK